MTEGTGLPTLVPFTYSHTFPPLCFTNKPSSSSLETIETGHSREFETTLFHTATRQFYKIMDQLLVSVTVTKRNDEPTFPLFPDATFLRLVNHERLSSIYLTCGSTLAEYGLYLMRHLHLQHQVRNADYRKKRKRQNV